MFKIGDRVKCIKADPFNNLKGIAPRLVLHREYIVYNIKENKCCNSITLDVGLVSKRDIAAVCICGNRNIKSDNIHWCSAKRFIKVQEKKEYISVQTEVEVTEPHLN